METTAAPDLWKQFRKAKDIRARWEPLWRECYSYALPHRDFDPATESRGQQKSVKLYDGTAPDGVDQLASSLLGELTPPWGQWFSFSPGAEASPEAGREASAALQKIGDTVRGHFERSNFAVEMHQCFLDLVTAGTACLLFEEAPMGRATAFRFTAVPLNQVAFEEGPDGKLDTTFRRSALEPEAFRSKFPNVSLPEMKGDFSLEAKKVRVLEVVKPGASGYSYWAVLDDETGASLGGAPLASGSFSRSPFINFRWLKAPGEIYGRSPVMKALPDIKTANKVVELILKNASIAVTGIWQADDDGVLNPANIQLIPGAVIPKAVGSQGLTPLKSPGDFDMSQLVLTDLRGRIRSALLSENLGQINAPQMTATEVIERSAEIFRLLSATYGRLQSELLVPLMERALGILSRRGDIPEFELDGRAVTMVWRSPLARAYARQEARETMSWIQALTALGPEATARIDAAVAARWLAKAFDIPEDLIRSLPEETQPDPPLVRTNAPAPPAERGHETAMNTDNN